MTPTTVIPLVSLPVPWCLRLLRWRPLRRVAPLVGLTLPQKSHLHPPPHRQAQCWYRPQQPYDAGMQPCLGRWLWTTPPCLLATRSACGTGHDRWGSRGTHRPDNKLAGSDLHVPEFHPRLLYRDHKLVFRSRLVARCRSQNGNHIVLLVVAIHKSATYVLQLKITSSTILPPLIRRVKLAVLDFLILQQ